MKINKKTLCSLAAVGLMAWGASYAMTATAEAASPIYQTYSSHADTEYNRAIERENKRHEQKVNEIQRKYRNHAQQSEMNRELRAEQERHEKAIRDAEKNHTRNAQAERSPSSSHDNHGTPHKGHDYHK